MRAGDPPRQLVVCPRNRFTSPGRGQKDPETRDFRALAEGRRLWPTEDQLQNHSRDTPLVPGSQAVRHGGWSLYRSRGLTDRNDGATAETREAHRQQPRLDGNCARYKEREKGPARRNVVTVAVTRLSSVADRVLRKTDRSVLNRWAFRIDSAPRPAPPSRTRARRSGHCVLRVVVEVLIKLGERCSTC